MSVWLHPPLGAVRSMPSSGTDHRRHAAGEKPVSLLKAPSSWGRLSSPVAWPALAVQSGGGALQD